MEGALLLCIGYILLYTEYTLTFSIVPCYLVNLTEVLEMSGACTVSTHVPVQLYSIIMVMIDY